MTFDPTEMGVVAAAPQEAPTPAAPNPVVQELAKIDWSTTCDGYDGDGYVMSYNLPIHRQKMMKSFLGFANEFDIRVLAEYENVMLPFLEFMYKDALKFCANQAKQGKGPSSIPSNFVVSFRASVHTRQNSHYGAESVFWTSNGREWIASNDGIGIEARKLVAADNKIAEQAKKRESEAVILQARRDAEAGAGGKFLQTRNLYDLQLYGIRLGMGNEAFDRLRLQAGQDCAADTRRAQAQLEEQYSGLLECSDKAKQFGSAFTSTINGRKVAQCGGTYKLSNGFNNTYALTYIEHPKTSRPQVSKFAADIPRCGKKLDVSGLFADAEKQWGKPDQITNDTFIGATCWIWGNAAGLHFRMCSRDDIWNGGKSMDFELEDEPLEQEAQKLYEQRTGQIARPSLQ